MTFNEPGQSRSRGTRKSRDACHLEVDFVVEGRRHHGVIENISASGAFIRKTGDFYQGQPITMTFTAPVKQTGIKMYGKIARITDEGLGIEFTYEPV
jgi:hypothetical protein